MAATTSILNAVRLVFYGSAIIWTASVLGCADSAKDPQPEVPLAVVSRVRLGMSERELTALRPNLQNNSGILAEHLGPGEIIIYWFGRNFRRPELPNNKLVAVVYSVDRTTTESTQTRLRQVADIWTKKFGNPDLLPTQASRRRNGKVIKENAMVWRTPDWWLIFSEDTVSDLDDANGGITVSVHSPSLPPAAAVPSH